MCIQTKIQQKLQQKAELDAQIAKLEQLELKTSPVKTLLAELLADYAMEAPEDLAAIWQEVLAIGQQFDLSVQPLAADELKAWESANAYEEPLTNEEYDAAVEEELALDDDEKDIPALTLWQPWATLIAEEVKRIETRSWATPYRGPIAIHAAKRPIYTGSPELLELLQKGSEPPLGAVVAIANLVDCVEMTPEFIAQQSDQELKCGDWQPGRFAWALEIIRPIVPPIPATGGQKLWNWAGTSIAAELEYLEKLKTAPKYEPEEATSTVESVLKSHGFFMPDVNLGDCYSSAQKYEDYRGWEIYRSCQDKGIDGIGLYTKQFGFWDASTEMIDEDDPTFPENFTNGNAILDWTRKVIDEVIAVTPIESSEVPGQLALEFPQSESESTELQKLEEKSAIRKELENLYQEALTENTGEPLTNDEYDAAVKEELALDDENETILITFQGREWLVEVLNEFRSGITILIQAKNREEGFTATVARKDVENNDCSLAKCAEQVLNERLTTQKQSQAASEPIAQEADTERCPNFNQIFDLQDFKVDVRQHNYAGEFAGASFNFYKIRENGATICAENLTYSKSLTAVECADKHPKALATEIIGTYWQKLREEEERRANPYKKPEDDFIELVKLTPAVGYIKRRDNGELISAYAAFANRDAAGEKTATLAKPRAKKWAEHLHASFESCGWKVEEPRKATRMVAESGAKQQFAYEIKIGGKFSIGQLQLLAEEDFSLLPNEVAAVKVPAALPTTAAPIYSVKVNGYEVATGSEEEMRVRFEEELKTFGKEGRDAIRLVRGNEIIDEWYLSEFAFVPAQDFDETNPEYWTLHTPTKTNFRVYRSLASGAAWVNSVYPYSALSTKEAAAVDAVRRQLKAGKTE